MIVGSVVPKGGGGALLDRIIFGTRGPTRLVRRAPSGLTFGGNIIQMGTEAYGPAHTKARADRVAAHAAPTSLHTET